MTFPSVAGTSALSSGSGSSMAVSLPAGIAAGDLLLVHLNVGSTMSVTTPSGWALLSSDVIASALKDLVFYRTADGSEGSSVTIAQGSSGQWGAIARRITGQDNGTVPAASAWKTSSTTTVTPNALTPSWGAADTLWLLFVGLSSGATSIVLPTGYTVDPQTNSFFKILVSAGRDNNAATETPGAVTWTGTSNAHVLTVGVKRALATTNQSISITCTTSVSLSRSISKIVAASLAGSVSIARAISKTTVSIASTSAATIIKSIGKPFAVTMSTAAIVTASRAFLVTISIGVSSSVSLVKSVGKVVSASLGAGVTVQKAIAKIISISSSILTSIRRIASNVGRKVRSVMMLWH